METIETKKPKWLKKLEQESWQAELLDLQLNAKHIYENYERSDRLQPNCYESNLLTDDDLILSALIEKEQIMGPLLKVFVPIFPNEEATVTSACGEFESPEDIERAEARKLRYAFFSDCYQKYHRFYINDSLYQVDLLKFEHPHRATSGVLTYLPTAHFRDGKNILRVEKIQPDSTLVYRTMNVPFWFAH